MLTLHADPSFGNLAAKIKGVCPKIYLLLQFFFHEIEPVSKRHTYAFDWLKNLTFLVTDLQKRVWSIYSVRCLSSIVASDWNLEIR